MATRYQHVLDTIRKDVADQVGGLLWDAETTGLADQPSQSRTGASVLLTVAEDARFELARGCTQHAFQVCGRAFTVGKCGL